MFIGIGRFEVFIPASRSLKDKRRVLRSVTSTVQHKLNVAIAEVDYLDLCQRTAIGVTCVAGSTGHCRRQLQEAERLIARQIVGAAELVSSSVDVLSMKEL